MIREHFPNAVGVDDFMARAEMALAGYGFAGDNSIGGWQPAASSPTIKCAWLVPEVGTIATAPPRPAPPPPAAMCNLCRDESCMVLEDKIETAFGSCFSTHGLGGVLTCGVVGIKAGLSHSPLFKVPGRPARGRCPCRSAQPAAPATVCHPGRQASRAQGPCGLWAANAPRAGPGGCSAAACSDEC
jgi:hypothetical protein